MAEKIPVAHPRPRSDRKTSLQLPLFSCCEFAKFRQDRTERLNVTDGVVPYVAYSQGANHRRRFIRENLTGITKRRDRTHRRAKPNNAECTCLMLQASMHRMQPVAMNGKQRQTVMMQIRRVRLCFPP